MDTYKKLKRDSNIRHSESKGDAGNHPRSQSNFTGLNDG